MADLYLYDPKFDEAGGKTIAKGMFGIDRDSVIPVNSWQGLATEIKKRRTSVNLYLHIMALRAE